MKTLKHAIITLILVGILLVQGKAQSQPGENEKAIRKYYSGWEIKDWNTVSGTLAAGFTFTSPAPDDHIPIDKFKEKCWEQAAHIKKFNLLRIDEKQNAAFILYELTTLENKVIRNTEFFTFNNGKIKSIECFFGGNGQGYPTNQK